MKIVGDLSVLIDKSFECAVFLRNQQRMWSLCIKVEIFNISSQKLQRDLNTIQYVTKADTEQFVSVRVQSVTN